MKNYTFPHVKTDVIDASMPPAIPEPDTSALHKPCFFGFAEQGEVNVPQYGPYSVLSKKLGKATFDQYWKGFMHPNLFAYTAGKYQAMYFVRLADTTKVKSSTLIIEAHVKEVEMIQYERDMFGAVIYVDGPSGKEPKKKDPETKEPGISLTWNVRALKQEELRGTNGELLGYKEEIPSIKTVGDTTIYPIFVMKASSPGAWANTSGVRLWFDPASVDRAIVDNIKGMVYFIQFMEQPYGLDTPQAIRTFFGNKYAEFSMDYNALDKSTDRRLYLNEILLNEYGDLPFSVELYHENAKLIGERIIAAETNRNDLTSPYMVNILTGRDIDNHSYDHFRVEVSSSDPEITIATMDANVTLYMRDGEDGNMDNAALESLSKAYWTGNVYPEIMDAPRYPITHLYDSGYTLETKKAMIDFLGVRDDVKVVMSTQDFNNPPNSKAEDQSTGSALRNRLLLHPESLIFGTMAFRGTIFQQCGRLVDMPTYRHHVPATIDALIKKCTWQGAFSYKGEPKGIPASLVTCFDVKTINWTPTSSDHKQLSWDNSLNYMQFFDSTQVHYADVIGVYPYAISLLSDDCLCDILIYLKHIARYEWSLFAGRREPFSVLANEVISSIKKNINQRFGNHIKVNVTMYQTDIDRYKGYANTIKIEVGSGFPQRVSHVLIPVVRSEG